MKNRCYILYPCGKKIELRISLTCTRDGNIVKIGPDDDLFFDEARKRFEVGSLKVIEEKLDLPTQEPRAGRFISIVRKIL